MTKISQLSDSQLIELVNNRWKSSESIWTIVEESYKKNIQVYQNKPGWMKDLPRMKSRVRANRVFSDMEAVINSLIANLPKVIVMPGRPAPESKELAVAQEKFFQIKYTERNIKETVRKGLRNLYFGRLIVLKPFWDAKINDWNARAVDPRKVRFGKTSTKEDDTEFAIEEIEDTLTAVLGRFPDKKDDILKKAGIESEADAFVKNPEIKYKEAWVRDYVCFVYDHMLLGKIRNPYWDWDGLLVTPDEEAQLKTVSGEARRQVFAGIRNEQATRKNSIVSKATSLQAAEDNRDKSQPDPTLMAPLENQDEPITYGAYYFNHFDQPRKPYIFATIFNNENKPIGETDMIDQATPLQENIDERKRDITENAKVVNGVIKVDSSVMSKQDAQGLRYEARGIIWGKGVVNGVQREAGQPLPAFVVEDMVDSRNQIDELMAASSAFKGIREGQETKGGRMALVDQSFLRLNELVQVVDYVNYELFNWFYQLAKVRYTEHHYAKTIGKDQALKILTIMQDDFEDGAEIRVIGGKTLPEDRQFKYEQAAEDVKAGIISPVDYLEMAGYESPNEKAKNTVIYSMNRMYAVGLAPEEIQKIYLPPIPKDTIRYSIDYKDLPPDGQIQLVAKTGLQLDPKIILAEKMAQQANEKAAITAKARQPIKSPFQINK